MVPVVSVLVIAYNQEKYVGKTLQSILEQKTQYPFEILVHDDASTDGTRSIIEYYANLYPNLISPIFEKENQFSLGKSLLPEMLLIAKGKYVAFCEGDDYWCSNLKIQKECEALEKHVDCCACVHPIRIVSKDDKVLNKPLGYPIGDKEKKLQGNEVVEYVLKTRTPLMQISSLMLRRKSIELQKISHVTTVSGVGDLWWELFPATQGNYWCLSEKMSAYREFSSESWSSKGCGDVSVSIGRISRIVQGLKLFDMYTKGKYTAQIWAAINNARMEMLLMQKSWRKKYPDEYQNFLETATRKIKIKCIISSKCPFAKAVWELFKNALKHD
jgi:hypothetical protein